MNWKDSRVWPLFYPAVFTIFAWWAARMFHGGRVLGRAGRPTLVATQSQETRKIRFWRTTASVPHHKKHSHRLTAHIYKLQIAPKWLHEIASYTSCVPKRHWPMWPSQTTSHESCGKVFWSKTTRKSDGQTRVSSTSPFLYVLDCHRFMAIYDNLIW